MKIKILSLIVLVSLACCAQGKNFDTIRLVDPDEPSSITGLQLRETRVIETNLTNTQKGDQFQFGRFEMGPLQTKLLLNPFSQQASISAQLDLIDSYSLMQSKPDFKDFIPYAVKNIRRDFERSYIKLQQLRQDL